MNNEKITNNHFKINHLDEKTAKKLKNKSKYLIDKLRRDGGNSAFSEFDTYYEKDAKREHYVMWNFIPAKITGIKLVNHTDLKNVRLFNQLWNIYQKNQSVVLVQDDTARKNNKTNISLYLSAEERIKAEKELKELKNELFSIFDFKDAHIISGATVSKRVYFNITVDTFSSILKALNIYIAQNEITRENEAIWHDEDNNIWIINISYLIALIQITGMFKIGKYGDQLVKHTSIYEQFKASQEDILSKGRYNPVLMYFNSCFRYKKPTNKIDILHSIINCFVINHGDDEDYHSACKSIIKKFLISCVSSIYKDEFNTRLAPIFVGRQGCGKSSFGKKLFGVMGDAFLTKGGMKMDKLDHQELLFMGWVLEIADSPQIFRKQDDFETYKGLTNSIFKIKKKYENSITTYKRHSTHYFTMNEIDLRDDENTRTPVIRLLDIDVEKMDSLLGLKHTGGGVVEQVYPQKLMDFWYQVKCCYDRKETYEMNAHEQTIFSKFINKNNKKTIIAIEFEGMFGLSEDFMYSQFLDETKRGKRYQVVNNKIIITKLAEMLSTDYKQYSPQDFDKRTGEIQTLINRYFKDVNLKTIRCPIEQKLVKGFKSPVFLSKREQENLLEEETHISEIINIKNKKNIQNTEEKEALELIRKARL